MMIRPVDAPQMFRNVGCLKIDRAYILKDPSKKAKTA